MYTSHLIEFVHALLMVAWIASWPFLLYQRWHRLTIVACVYNLLFVLVNRVSHWFLGECIFTRLARSAGGEQNGEWFTVKLSRVVFGFIPTNRQVVYVEQVVIAIVSLLILVSVIKNRR